MDATLRVIVAGRNKSKKRKLIYPLQLYGYNPGTGRYGRSLISRHLTGPTPVRLIAPQDGTL